MYALKKLTFVRTSKREVIISVRVLVWSGISISLACLIKLPFKKTRNVTSFVLCNQYISIHRVDQEREIQIYQLFMSVKQNQAQTRRMDRLKSADDSIIRNQPTRQTTKRWCLFNYFLINSLISNVRSYVLEPERTEEE